MKYSVSQMVVGVACVIALPLVAYAQSSSPATSASATAPVADSKAADRALRKDVVRALTRTKGLNSTRITVRVKEAAVTLEGSVPEQAQADLATQAAQSVSGVTSVKNALAIFGLSGSQ
ncbi:BON domain-containing protein [Paraburkholderia phenoliruptrix]|uniref:BON domain-containing protein n=1 Tax=Paraburkholderia phenoliruptrix TaxID=252970 RepID=UPI0001C02EF0